MMSAKELIFHERLHAVENQSNLRIKFAVVGKQGEYVSDALSDHYFKFFEGLPPGWAVAPVAMI